MMHFCLFPYFHIVSQIKTLITYEYFWNYIIFFIHEALFSRHSLSTYLDKRTRNEIRTKKVRFQKEEQLILIFI